MGTKTFVYTKCLTCGEHTPASRFCCNCGALKERIKGETAETMDCPHCGKAVAIGKYCGSCGKRI